MKGSNTNGRIMVSKAPVGHGLQNLPFDSDGEGLERRLYNLYRFIMSTDVNVINTDEDVTDAKPTVRRSLSILVYLMV